MKKISLLITLLAAFIAGIFLFAGCEATSEPPQDNAESTLTVTFMRDNQVVYTAETEYGVPVEKPHGLPDESFIVWLFNGMEYDFNKPVTNDIVLTASLTKSFEISFMADGVLIKKDSYSYRNRDVDEPEIPDKPHCTAEWEKYELTGGNITVNAIYSPVFYFVRYTYGGTLLHGYTCVYDDISDNAPPVEEKRGYSPEWEYSFDGEECTAALKYIPVEYSVSFIIDGKAVETQTATILDEGSPWELPDIPEREHYTSEWVKSKVEGACVEYIPRYTPITYKAEFYDGEEKLYERSYNMENAVIDEPPTPVREHYTCEWESYALDGGNKRINLKVAPVTYKIEFYAEGKLSYTVYYTVEDEKITPPPVPEILGAYGEWESFTQDGGDKTVKANYTFLEGTAGLLYRENDEDGYTLYAYAGNESKVTVPVYYNGKKITRIAEEAFNPNVQSYTCALEEVYMYGGVHTIEKNAFLSCDKLKKLRLPDSLKEIGEGAFMSCSSLESFEFPDGVETIGNSAFANCGMAFVKLPASLKIVETYAFAFCNNLTELDTSDGVEYISSYAFVNCAALETIIFGKGMKKIDTNAFYMVKTVTYAEFKEPDGWTFNSTVASWDISDIFSDPVTAAETLMNYEPNDGVYYEKADGETPSA